MAVNKIATFIASAD
jgi:hypothetical protein